MTQTISTIVDMNSVRNSMIMVYMTQTISTIVDFKSSHHGTR